jgi:hypothetical protein
MEVNNWLACVKGNSRNICTDAPSLGFNVLCFTTIPERTCVYCLFHNNTWKYLCFFISQQYLNVLVFLYFTTIPESTCVSLFHNNTWTYLCFFISQQYLNVFVFLYFTTIPERTCVSLFHNSTWTHLCFSVRYFFLHEYSSNFFIYFLNQFIFFQDSFSTKIIVMNSATESVTITNTCTSESRSRLWLPRKFLCYWMWWSKSFVYECNDNERFYPQLWLQQSCLFIIFGIADYFVSDYNICYPKYLKLSNLFMNATTPNCLVQETSH